MFLVLDLIRITANVQDRSRSPVRDRSRSPKPSYESGRESREPRDSRDSRRGRGNSRGGSRGNRGSRGSRGGYRGSSRDYRGDYKRTQAPSEEYRIKTERNYDNSIFVGNIPFNCSSQDVEQIFKGEYDIVRADIVTNRGQSRGMATVEFSSKEDVRQAISKYDHSEYRGREIFVRQDYPPPEKQNERSNARNYERSERSDRSERQERKEPRRQDKRTNDRTEKPKSGTEIFVGNLPFSVNWQALKDLMRKAGEVMRADVRLDNMGKSRGFGTVVFATAEAAAKAVEEFQGFEIEGRKLDTRPGRSFEKPAPKNSDFTKDVLGDGPVSNTIYAANLPYVTNVDDLYELFETIGRVNKAELQYNDMGKPKGCAVIQFELEELADLAIKNLNGYNYGGRDLAISYANRGEEPAEDIAEVAPTDSVESVAEPSESAEDPIESVDADPMEETDI